MEKVPTSQSGMENSLQLTVGLELPLLVPQIPDLQSNAPQQSKLDEQALPEFLQLPPPLPPLPLPPLLGPQAGTGANERGQRGASDSDRTGIRSHPRITRRVNS
jgi:hypothetical protein